MIRNNERYFEHPYYRTLLSMSFSDSEHHPPMLPIQKDMLFIEGWLLLTLNQFRHFVENSSTHKEVHI
jgi:hypothetical protein